MNRMTVQEAIEYIKAHCNPDYPNGKTDWELAMNIAIKVLEKQVPKNPVGAADKSGMWLEGTLLCPDCNTYFGEVFDEGYCRKCGRKLIQKRVRVIEAR